MRVITFLAVASSLLAQPCFANNFEVLRCKAQGANNGMRMDLKAVRQVRNSGNPQFINSGDLNVTVQFEELVTTLGALHFSGNTNMKWTNSNQTVSARYITANSTDGSVFAAQVVPAQVFVAAFNDNPAIKAELQGAFFNDTLLRVYKIKVSDPVVDYLNITLQQTESSGTYHAQMAAVNSAGTHALVQLDIPCTLDYSEKAE